MNETNSFFYYYIRHHQIRLSPEEISGLVETVRESPVRKSDWLVLLSTKGESPPLGDI